MVESLSLSPCAHRQGFEPISPPSGAAGSPPSYAAYYGKAELLGKVKELPEVAEGSSEEEEELERELVEKKVTGMGVSWWRMLAALLHSCRNAGCGVQRSVRGCWLHPFTLQDCSSSMHGFWLHASVHARMGAACLHPCSDASCMSPSVQRCRLHASIHAIMLAASLIYA